MKQDKQLYNKEINDSCTMGKLQVGHKRIAVINAKNTIIVRIYPEVDFS